VNVTPNTAGAFELSEAAIVARILDRHEGDIDVKSRHVMLANLTRILRAALSLSLRQGFHAMSMRALAREAGMSMGGLYAYVDHKDTLLSMILQEVTHTGVGVLRGVPSDLRDDPQAELRWLIETHIRTTEAMKRWFAFVFLEAKAFPAKDRRIAQTAEEETTRILADAVQRGMDAGVFAPEDADLIASLIKPLLQEWYLKPHKYKRRKITVDDYIDTVTRLVERGLMLVAPSDARQSA